VREFSPVTVMGEREKLRVAIDNLFSNAVKFSPDGGVITLRLYQEGTLAILDILDQGEGVAAEDAGMIFDAFYQGKTHGRDNFKGSGLGLAIAEDYIMACGGSIQLIPSATGAHFRISITTGNVQ
jgi:two-component system sensor histidine kinase GlrK